MMTQTLSRLGGAALDLLYPPRCALCQRHGAFLCAACRESLPRADGPRCDACWLPLRGPDCRACVQHPTALTHLRSAYRYESGVRALVHAFKFRGQSSLGKTLAAEMSRCYTDQGLQADVIVPAPLTTVRRRSRGYNQALLLAREIAREAGVPVAEALRRTGSSTPQARTATAEQRRQNVAGAFEVARPADIMGRRVLLIDDVATTGATLNVCATELLAAGAIEVSGLTFGRED